MSRDATYNSANYHARGGNEFHVSGKLVIDTGGQLVPNSGTQAATVPTTSGQSLGFVSTQLDAVVVALKNVGILAAS